VVVVMAVAATRPVLGSGAATDDGLALGAVGLPRGGSRFSSSLRVGSFITEPAAMRSAHCSWENSFTLQPERAAEYATLVLLFVNISVGGTFTHSRAARFDGGRRVQWGLRHMLQDFGWKAELNRGATLIFPELSRGVTGSEGEGRGASSGSDEKETGRTLLVNRHPSSHSWL